MIFLIATVALISIIELDGVHVGQFMLARPLVLGPLVGTLFGQVALGSALGALTEMFTLEVLPVGACTVPNATVAAATALLLALGPKAVAPALAFPAGLGAGWAFQALEARIRQRSAAFSGPLQVRLDEGRPRAFEGVIASSLVRQAAVTAAFLAAVLCVRPALSWGWEKLPGFIQEGFGLGLTLAPWLGAATLAQALWAR